MLPGDEQDIGFARRAIGSCAHLEWRDQRLAERAGAAVALQKFGKEDNQVLMAQ